MAERRRHRRPAKDSKSTGVEMYDKMHKYVASKNQLDRHGYPRPSEILGIAAFRCSPPKESFNASEQKRCERCGVEFVINKSGEVLGGTCTYHYGRCFDDVWQCCEAKRGETGCMTSETHVHRDNNLDVSGYVQVPKIAHAYGTNPGIYAVDCEMSYTIAGLEVTQVTIVDHKCEVVYDEYVKPYGRILSYNTEHSGVTEENLRGVTTSLDDVQRFMLQEFSADTILIGHSLESDLSTLRLIHETVVDTALVFTHPKGYPYKFRLRTLAKRKLGRTVQESTHDSKEDASVCMQIMMRKIFPQG